MNHETSWMELHLAGVELERSSDGINWYPITVEEPFAGDGYYYRKAEHPENGSPDNEPLKF